MRIEVFQGKGGWYWRFRAKNGKITADAESFVSKAHAIRAAKAVVRGVTKAVINFPDVVTFRSDNADGVTMIRWH